MSTYSGISTNIPPIISRHAHCKVYCTKKQTLIPQKFVISVVIAFLIPRERIESQSMG